MPAFRGPNGQFDQATFETVLRNNGLTEPRFIEMMRGDLAQQQLLDRDQRRRGDAGRCCCIRCSRAGSRSARPTWWNFRSPPHPNRPHRPRPTLQRWYDNHPDLYASPGVPPDQGCRAVAADTGQGDSDHRCRSSGGLSAAQVAVHDAGQALGRGHLGVRRSKGEVAGRSVARRRGLAGDAEGGAGDRCLRRSPSTMPPSANFPTRNWHGMVFAAGPDTVAGPVKGALGWYRRAGHEGHVGQRSDVRPGEGQAAGTSGGRKGRGPDV